VLWPAAFPGHEFDGDNPQHVAWVYDKALERAQHYGIEGITYRLTQGVVKNIIPAIASTNAIIAGTCALETLKIVSLCSTGLDNMLMYVGTDSVYTLASRYEKDASCTSCSPPVHVACEAEDTLEALLHAAMDALGVPRSSESFSLSFEGRVLYSTRPGGAFGDTSGNLGLTLRALGLAEGPSPVLHVPESGKKIALSWID
jgi:ubiquitin-activating enzyme E1 C